MSRIWIIEAAGKVKSLKRALADAGHPSDRVLATHGRLYDLADDLHRVSNEILKDLNTIRWEPLRKEQINQLMDLTRNASEIVIATDADLEGELIAHHFVKAFARPGVAFSRAYLMGFTAEHVSEATQARKAIDTNRVFSAIARRLFDRHLGYQLISEEDHFRMSMGRVVSPLVQSLLEQPAITTRVECDLKDGWKAVFSLPSHLGSQAQILCSILSDLKPVEPILESVETVTEEKKPLTGPEAILLCSNEINKPIDEIMASLQSNYMEGRLSYPRTDSRRMGEISTKWAKRMAEAQGIPFSLDHLEKRQNEACERSFDAHEALTPLTDYMASRTISSEHLSTEDAVLATISRHCAHIGSPTTTLKLERGKFGNDQASQQWAKVVKNFIPHLSIERVRSEDGAILPRTRVITKKKPNFESTRIRMWKDSPALTAAKRMIEMGLGRPSTISQIAGKAAKNYLDENGQVNGRGKLMLHKVNERCPELLKNGVAQKVEQALIADGAKRSVADRLSLAWQLLRQKPLRETTDVKPSVTPQQPEKLDNDHAEAHKEQDIGNEPPSFSFD